MGSSCAALYSGVLNIPSIVNLNASPEIRLQTQKAVNPRTGSRPQLPSEPSSPHSPIHQKTHFIIDISTRYTRHFPTVQVQCLLIHFVNTRSESGEVVIISLRLRCTITLPLLRNIHSRVRCTISCQDQVLLYFCPYTASDANPDAEVYTGTQPSTYLICSLSLGL